MHTLTGDMVTTIMDMPQSDTRVTRTEPATGTITVTIMDMLPVTRNRRHMVTRRRRQCQQQQLPPRLPRMARLNRHPG